MFGLDIFCFHFYWKQEMKVKICLVWFYWKYFLKTFSKMTENMETTNHHFQPFLQKLKNKIWKQGDGIFVIMWKTIIWSFFLPKPTATLWTLLWPFQCYFSLFLLTLVLFCWLLASTDEVCSFSIWDKRSGLLPPSTFVVTSPLPWVATSTAPRSVAICISTIDGVLLAATCSRTFIVVHSSLTADDIAIGASP